MSKITSFNRQNLRSLRDKLEQVLGEVGNEFGVVISVGSMSFSESQTTSRITMTAIGDNVQKGESPSDSKARVEFENYADRFGLSPDDFGKVISIRGETFEIVGIKPKSSKYPILGKNKATGKVYKLPVESVSLQLAS